jgi:mycobactin salicyl-AMP ligase
VVEAGVAGIPDAERGQAVCAVVVPRPRSVFPGPAALAEWVSERFDHLAVPGQILVADRLPRTALGKADRQRVGWWVLTGGPM